ncbi:winged helix-turn-helix transcriptional regulator [Edaphocola aurantiacus]|uniref:winged helix-turn-helix transcriptional regulator n=1 Tax=Edaphocola aurantiacus TaxID=2601682 RepID=UPI001C982F02|nr:helix-turn-helix domain-containing protein [Edaphocola aurantiacus]
MRKEHSTNTINEQTLQQFCNAAKTLALFQGRWKLSILFHLQEGPSHYTAFKQLLPAVSDRTLSKQLNELMADGVIVKEKTKTESIYTLSPYGHSLGPVLSALSGFLHQP